jgi:hypothetical protein
VNGATLAALEMPAANRVIVARLLGETGGGQCL